MGEPRRKNVQVLDSTAILAGLLEYGPDQLVTVLEVVNEVRYGGLAPERLATALESGLLVVKAPKPTSITRVTEAAAKTGDLASLSEADISLIAAALDEKKAGVDVTLISDDYSVQNTARYLGLNVRGSIHPPIKKPLLWVFRCSGCGLQLDTPTDICPRCGAEVVKKVRRDSL